MNNTARRALRGLLLLTAASVVSRAAEYLPAFGALTLTQCEIGRYGIAGVGTVSAYCADFDVPENWNSPSGRHIKLHVAIVKARPRTARAIWSLFSTGARRGGN